MASSSGGAAAGKECESCQSAPGIPFCRVEWSFLCAGCAAVVHANNWIIAVPTNPNPSPYPNSNSNPNPDPNLVVQLSSDDDARAGGRRGWRRSAGKAAPPPQPRVESVMRYKEKRKTRKFEKTVRYETRKAYAEQRPRIDGKFARPAGSGAEGTPVASDEVGLVDAHFMAMPVAGDEVGMPDAYFPATESSRGLEPHASEEVMLQIGSEELGLMDAGEEVRLL